MEKQSNDIDDLLQKKGDGDISSKDDLDSNLLGSMIGYKVGLEIMNQLKSVNNLNPEENYCMLSFGYNENLYTKVRSYFLELYDTLDKVELGYEQIFTSSQPDKSYIVLYNTNYLPIFKQKLIDLIKS